MSVNISVSGKTLKECHDQICALADEIKGYTNEEPMMVGPAVPMKFAITPEVARESSPSNSVGQVGSTGMAVPQQSMGNTTTSTDMVDSRGIPWDARIHSSNKEQGKDGVWRRRRGVDPQLEKQVEAELMGNAAPKSVPPFGSMAPEQYQQAVAPVHKLAPMPTTEHRVALPEVNNVLNQAQIPAQTTPVFAPPAPAQVLPPNTHNQESFRNNLVTILNDLVVAGKIDYNWINSQKVQFAGKDVTQWHENQAACAELFNAFVGWKLINKL